MESTDTNPPSRTADAMISKLDERYAETDSDRAWSRLKEFAQPPRKSGENLKDSRTRINRATTRSDALSMK